MIVIVDLIDKLNSMIDFMKGDELADPNMAMDLTPCQDTTYLTLVATTSSKPLGIEINHIKMIMHIEVNYILIEWDSTLNPIIYPNTFMLVMFPFLFRQETDNW